MSIDHTCEIGRDECTKVFLNIAGVDTGACSTEWVSCSLYAYDTCDGSSKFTCTLTIEDLQRLYHHLKQYSMIKESNPKTTGKFIELNADSDELLSILSSARLDAIVPVMKNFVANRLSEVDVNTILGRKDALSEFYSMLQHPDDYIESAWQSFFERNEWIFGYGLKYRYLTILQREAHVSGTDIDGRNSVISDFLLSDLRFTKLVELKTPKTKLFERQQYRSDSWRLSTDLTNAVSQILAQKANWEIESTGNNYTADGQRIEESAYDVECILVIGQHSGITGSPREVAIKQKTLELYRRNLRNIEILLYDELYERAKFIVEGQGSATLDTGSLIPTSMVEGG